MPLIWKLIGNEKLLWTLETKIMNFGTNEKLLFVIDGDLEI